MIDTIEQQTSCKACGKPLTQLRGHRKRLYCNDACQQAAYRIRKDQHHHGVTIDVTNDDSTLQVRIAELEQELVFSQQNLAVCQEKLFQTSSHIQKLERQVAIQRQRLSQSNPQPIIDSQIEEQNIRRIEQYAIDCSLDAGWSKERIAELEFQVKELSARLALEDAYRYDTQERHFKSWLRKHPQARDTAEVFKRILADTQLPQHGSRSLYEARMRLNGYTAEEIALFQGAWKDMMFMQS